MKLENAITLMALMFAIGVVVGTINNYSGSDLRRDCIEAGETIIGDTFFSCEPVGSVVNGKRIAFKKAYRSELNE